MNKNVTVNAENIKKAEVEEQTKHHRTMSDAMDTAVLGPAHWKIWALSAMGIFLDGYDLFIIGVAMPFIKHSFTTSPYEVGLIGAAAVLGAMVGAFFGGRLTDKLGRKSIYMLDLLIFIVFGLLSGLAWGVWSLIAFRFVLGIGIGADYPICASYVAEFMPSKLRGKMLIGAFSFQALGMAAAAGVALMLIHLSAGTDAWRWMLMSGSIPALLVLVMRSSVPESARWLMSKGHTKKAAKVVSLLVPEKKKQLLPIMEREADYIVTIKGKQLGTKALFSPRFLRRTILAALPWFIMDIATYGVGIFTPIILAAMAFHGDGLNWVTKDFKATEGAMLLDLLLVVGFLLNIWLVERWGRIRLQTIGFIGMAIGLGTLALAGYRLDAGNAPSLLLIFLGFGIFNVLMNMGPNACTFILPAELFPTEVRASAHGFSASCAKFGAALGIFLLPILKNTQGLTITLGILAVVSLAGFVVTYLARVETKGRSLETLNPVKVEWS